MSNEPVRPPRPLCIARPQPVRPEVLPEPQDDPVARIESRVEKVRRIFSYVNEISAEFKDDPNFPWQMFNRIVDREKLRIMRGEDDNEY
jgi:hypothetical protein